MQKVFVYGTLMKGLINHDLLILSRFLGNAVLHGYGLYRVDPDYPGIVKKTGAAIRGEVYEVDEATLEQLDYLEGEGSLYARHLEHCRLEDGADRQVNIYCWLGKVEERDYVPLEFTPWCP